MRRGRAKKYNKMFQSLLPPCATVWADINTEMRMTSSYVQPNHHKWHDINSARQLFFSWPVLHFALVCGSVPLLSAPPDSTLTARQRSRKMAVIHFVPRHRQGSFSLLPITSRPDSASQQDTAPFRSGPDPPYSRGLRLVDDPLQILSAPPASIRGTSLHLQENCRKKKKKDGSFTVSQTGGSNGWFLSSSKINTHYPKKYISLPEGTLASVFQYS